MEEQIVDRGSFRRVLQVSKNQLSLLKWYYTPIHSNNTVKNFLIKQSWYSYHIHLHVYFCLPELDLEKGQSGFRPLYSTHFRKSWDIS